jgi:DNA repair exonuclease SbcCD nuclease subunit
MTSVLFIGDPHFQVDNIPEINIFLDKLEELARTQNPTIICIGGDILHTHERLHTIPLNKAYDLVERMRKITKTYVLVGNHDAINNQIFLTDNHWMNGMKEWSNVVIVDKVEHLDINGVHMVFCPYVPPGRFQEALNSNEREWRNSHCIFAHQEFAGCKMGAIVSVDGDKWPEDYPFIVSGHIHENQRPQKNVYYPGSAMQHAFGESDKNIISIISWDDSGEHVITEHDLDMPRKRIIYTNIEDVTELEPPKTDDKIKITISGNYEEFKTFKKSQKYRDIVKTGTKVVFKPRKHDKKEIGKTQIDETDFNKILYALILNEEDSYLYQAHEQIVNGKKIEVKDVFFLNRL